ncbi:U1 small nuclear ribonucleoprotein C-like protein isoform X1 [Cinnamomum micranthum f. kanehirae]|uniref:U1 small nuclear ribonucleoprotein C-like protein isoform X1 n=1 Tax=Cinnamomum micranthum f. kanehirae TaxID=337451 RepID=A0A443PMW8_9MAGN|nr:U1 small nuclear ribonucleoprotein C-like protein isoform X1 [Cinnamomum micranthum f. kanehirae]
MGASSQPLMNPPLLPGMRPPILPHPMAGAPGYGAAPTMPSMMGPPGASSLPMQVPGLPQHPKMNPPAPAVLVSISVLVLLPRREYLAEVEVSVTIVEMRCLAELVLLPSSSAEVPSSGAEVPSSGAEVPSSGAEIPSSGAEVPSSGAESRPSSGAEVPSSGAEIPSSGAEVPSSGAEVPSSGAKIPSSGVEVLSLGAEVPSSGAEILSSGAEISPHNCPLAPELLEFCNTWRSGAKYYDGRENFTAGSATELKPPSSIQGVPQLYEVFFYSPDALLRVQNRGRYRYITAVM